MNEITNGAVTLLNGVLTTAHAMVQPWIGLSSIIGLSLIWMAVLEVEHLDRVSSGKPTVERH